MSQLTQIEKLINQRTSLLKLVKNAPEDEGRFFIEERLAELEKILSTMDSNETTYASFMNFLFKKEIAEVTESNLTLYKPKIALTYAPPQVGKSNAMIEIIKDCILKNTSVVVSSDNKRDQMTQLFSRLVKSVKENYETIFKECLITTVDSSDFKSIVKQMEKHKFFVVFCLDNKAQIKKVHEKINAIRKKNTFIDLCLIHDEADVITKDRNIEEIIKTQPESHKKWLEFTSDMYSTGIDLKRVFVTATPENVIYFYKPGFVWELPVPENYVSYKDIRTSYINNFDLRHVIRIIRGEIRDRYKENGIILYCVERNKDEINEEDPRSNQMQVFMHVLTNIRKIGLDVVSIYNSNGFKFAFKLQKHQTLFVNKMKEQSIPYVISENSILTLKKTDLSISEFYGYLQWAGVQFVLTIGKDLISRGISFVSNYKENPLTATTMIYKPGTQLSQVALTQAIGRLNGTAQPKLARRLYTTEDVYSNYTTFMQNQREIMDAIRGNGNKVDDDLIQEIALWKDTRPVDRKSLKLEKDMIFWEDSQSGSEDDDGYASDDQTIDGVKLNKLKEWIHSETLVGRMINYLYTCENPITLEEFKNELDYTNRHNEFLSNIKNGWGLKCQYGKLWVYNKTNDTIIINVNIRTYIKNM